MKGESFEPGDRVRFERRNWQMFRGDHLEEVTDPDGPYTVESLVGSNLNPRVVLSDVFNGREFPMSYLELAPAVSWDI